MTIKEFAEKYMLPYKLAYEASYKVNPVESDIRLKDFPESDLLAEAKRLVNTRIDAHQTSLDRLIIARDRMEGVAK